jgi:hypothetical protein
MHRAFKVILTAAEHVTLLCFGYIVIFFGVSQEKEGNHLKAIFIYTSTRTRETSKVVLIIGESS